MRSKTLISLLVLLIAGQSVFASADLHEFLLGSSQHEQSHQQLEASHQHAASPHQHALEPAQSISVEQQNLDADCGHCCQCHSPNLVYVLMPVVGLQPLTSNRSVESLAFNSQSRITPPALRPPIA